MSKDIDALIAELQNIGSTGHFWCDKARQAAAALAALRADAERKDAALDKAREDINWMLNNRRFLNTDVFDYIDAAREAKP